MSTDPPPLVDPHSTQRLPFVEKTRAVPIWLRAVGMVSMGLVLLSFGLSVGAILFVPMVHASVHPTYAGSSLLAAVFLLIPCGTGADCLHHAWALWKTR